MLLMRYRALLLSLIILFYSARESSRRRVCGYSQREGIKFVVGGGRYSFWNFLDCWRVVVVKWL